METYRRKENERTARPILFFKEKRNKNKKEKLKRKVKNPIKTVKIGKNRKKSIKMAKNTLLYTHTVCIYTLYIREEGPLCTLLGKRVPTSLSCRLGSPVFRCGITSNK